jgi:polyhydroxyalkanoate synthesis regulator phasin
MTDAEKERLVEIMADYHTREIRNLADHLLRNFRGEVDVISGKLDRLRERVDALDGKPTEDEGS